MECVNLYKWVDQHIIVVHLLFWGHMSSLSVTFIQLGLRRRAVSPPSRSPEDPENL
jgi:hypothetical protein